MSLIIAKIISGKIYIESDTKITDKDAVRTDPLCGLLKTIIIHPCISISFAGVIYFAEKALKNIFEINEFDLNSLTELLYNSHIKSGNKTDFIIASLINNEPKLIKISNNKIEHDVNSAWIGEYDGFKYFQSNYLPLLSEGVDEILSFKNSFKKVIDNSNIDTIGNFQISLHTDDKICLEHYVFLYTTEIGIYASEPQTIDIETAGELKPIPLGTASCGSFGISYLATISPNFHGVAIHFTHGNFGTIFCPQLSFSGIIVSNVNGIEFAKHIKDKYGIPLSGFVKLDETKVQYINTAE